MNTQKPMNVDLSKCDTIFCACGSQFWQQVTVAKRVKGLMIGASDDTLAQINVLRCDECKKLMPEAEKLIGISKPKIDLMVTPTTKIN